MNRRSDTPIDLDRWPEFDPSALPKKQRKAFAARRQADELYVADTAVSAIELQTGVNRRQLYRLLAHCRTAHSDGRVFGWRALVPYIHVARYQRTVKIRLQGDGAGGASAFGFLLEANPSLTAWIAEQIRAERVSVEQLSAEDGLRLRVRGLTKLHGAFLRSNAFHSTSRGLTESTSQPGVETGIEQEKSRPVAAFSFKINNLQKIVGGVDGTRTRDPRRDRPVF